MLDQSFSIANFNKIFLIENRKGNFNKSYFTNEYLDKHEEFKRILEEKNSFKKINGSLSKDELDDYKERLDKINKEKEEIRLNVFEQISDGISKSDFQFDIQYNNLKEVFTIKNNAVSYFAIKQIQYNVKKTFKVIQANRNLIIKQLYSILSDNYPKVIIKTDIKSFYESISQEILFHKIENNTLLTPFSKKLIRKLFYEYENKKDLSKIELKKGIPRGIGLSAYLSELFMKEIDSEIKSLDDLIYYARYVDDIVVIFAPKTESTKGDYFESIKSIVEKQELFLKSSNIASDNKTFVIDIQKSGITSGSKKSFDFLGYNFDLNNNKLKIEISKTKKERYISRIEKSIAVYNSDSSYNEKKARKLLFERFKFLTGNYHLNHNKRNIKAGIFYSNSMLILNTGQKSTNDLQSTFLRKINNISIHENHPLDSSKLIKHIGEKFNFNKGFNEKEKCFYSFSMNKSEYKYYNNKFGKVVSKFEVIKSIWIND